MAAATKVAVPRYVERDSYLNWFASYHAPANALDNSGAQAVFSLNVKGLRRIAVHLTVGTFALAAFQIRGLLGDADATPMVLKSTTADYTTALHGVLIDVSGDLSTLAVGGGWFVLETSGFDTIELWANSSNAGGSTLALDAGGSTF